MLLTVHKAGSSYVGGIFQEIFAKHGYDVSDPLAEVFDRGANFSSHIADQAERLQRAGCFFGPFRSLFNGLAAHIANARPIIHVRDPRDCVVSFYYSMRYSHVLPAGAPGLIMAKYRETLQRIDIDGFVENLVIGGKQLDEAFSRTFNQLAAIRAARPDAILSRYEDMVEEFPDWLVGIVEQFGIEIDYEMIIDLIARTDFLVKLRVEENPHNHKRQITPGDFRRKLTPRSQALLTRFYEQELDWFGYR